jgi:hypothetical protein
VNSDIHLVDALTVNRSRWEQRRTSRTGEACKPHVDRRTEVGVIDSGRRRCDKRREWRGPAGECSRRSGRSDGEGRLDAMPSTATETDA